ncbi:MAG: hypothetical protein PQ964_04850 [Methanobacteriaceae archaeon]|jgi:hypothetical protein
MDGTINKIIQVVGSSAQDCVNYSVTIQNTLSIRDNGSFIQDIRFTSEDETDNYPYSLESLSDIVIDSTINFDSGCVLSDGTILVHKLRTFEIWKSTDEGNTFTYLSTLSGITDNFAGRMFVSNSGSIFIGIGGKVFRSNDNGNTFTSVLNLPFTGSSWINLCVWNFIQDSSDNIYGGVYSLPAEKSTCAYVIKSSDGGSTWTNTIADTSARHCHVIGINQYNGWIYACLEGNNPVSNSKVCRSKDNGSTWVTINTGGQFTGFATKGDSNKIYLGLDNLQDSAVFYINDGGTNSEPFNLLINFGDYGFISDMYILPDDNIILWTKRNGATGNAKIIKTTTTDWLNWETVETSPSLHNWDGYWIGFIYNHSETTKVFVYRSWSGASGLISIVNGIAIFKFKVPLIPQNGSLRELIKKYFTQRVKSLSFAKKWIEKFL